MLNLITLICGSICLHPTYSNVLEGKSKEINKKEDMEN